MLLTMVMMIMIKFGPDCLKIIDEFENHRDDQDYLKHNSYFLLFYKSELLASFSVYNF